MAEATIYKLIRWDCPECNTVQDIDSEEAQVVECEGCGTEVYLVLERKT